MPIDSDALADEIMGTKKPVAINAEELASTLLEGHQASASELLESDFSPGNYAPFSLRWSLARGDTLAEKQLRIKKRYPEGEIDVLPKSLIMGFDDDMLIWRESPQQQWKAVEPQGFDKFDIAEAIAPSTEAIIAETGMAIGSGGASVPMTIGRQALGAFVGESLEQGLQKIRGLQEQGLGEAAGEAAEEGVLSIVGGAIASPFQAMINILRGRGALKVGEEGLETIQAAKELSEEVDALGRKTYPIAEKFTPALVTDNPAIRLSEAQSSALLPGLQRRYRELIAMIDTAISTKSPGNIESAMDDVVEALDDFNEQFIRDIRKIGTTRSEGGAALREGVEQYSELSRRQVNRLYAAARQLEEPEFDMAPVQRLAEDLRAGSKGILDPRVDAQIRALEDIDGPIQISDERVVSVTDQIRNVRTELFALKHVEPGQVANQRTGQANDMYRALTDVLNNPQNTSKEFRAAWRAANKAASDRLTKLEAAPIVAAAKSQNPADLVQSYLRPHQSDNLLAIRGTIPQNKWKQFVDAAYTDLISDPANLSKRLKAFDQETLDVFMPRSEQVLWRRVAKEVDRINAVGVDQIVETQVANRNFVDALISEANPRKVLTLQRAMAATNNRNMEKSLKAAIVEWAWDGIVVPKKNRLEIKSDLLAGRIKSLKKSKMWTLLSSDERRLIGNAQIVSRAFQQVVDAGTSIQAAEAVKGLKGLQKSAIITFLQSELVAQFYMSNMGRRILIGSGLPNSNGRVLRLLAGALAQTAPPEDISELMEEDK